MAYYYATATPFSSNLLFKQPLPSKIQAVIRPLIVMNGVEFHYLKGMILHLSHHKPGVFTSTVDWALHILARLPTDNTYWHHAAIGPDTLGFFLEDWGSEKAGHVAGSLPQRKPITDFEEFSSKYRLYYAERQQSRKTP